MNRRRILQIAGIAVAIIVVVLVAIPFLVDVNSFRPKLESELSSALGRQVKVGNLSLSIMSGTVSADDLSIADDPAFGAAPFVTTKRFKAGVELKPLIFDKALHITEVKLEEPQIILISAKNGTWNFSSIGGKSANTKPSDSSTPEMSVARLIVSNGKLLLAKVNSKEKPQVFDKVNIEVTNLSPTSKFPFSLTALLPGGGDLSVQGKAGPLDANNAAATPVEASVKVSKLDLAASGFVDPSTGVAGMADFDGTLNSDGKQAKTTGTLTATNLKLAPKGIPSTRSVSVKYAADHNLETQAGKLTQGDITMGKALAHLTGGYQTAGSVPTLDMKLDGQGMSVDELEAMLPALGIVLPSGSQLKGGTLSVSDSIVGPADKLVITGPVRLSNTRLAGFNLGSKLAAVSALSGKQTGGADTSIQNLNANVRVAPEGTRADGINLTIPAMGVVTGAGTVSPSGALDFKMIANLSGGAITSVTQVAGLGGNGGGSRVPFAITGTTSDPKFVPDIKGVAGSMVTNALTKQLGGSVPKGVPTNPLGGLFGGKKPR
jgi:AsmA protein